MISIIICSRYSSLSQELQSNIHATIGACEYELVHIDNSENKYNILKRTILVSAKHRETYFVSCMRIFCFTQKTGVGKWQDGLLTTNMA